jgi:hypothetical protein
VPASSPARTLSACSDRTNTGGPPRHAFLREIVNQRRTEPADRFACMIRMSDFGRRVVVVLLPVRRLHGRGVLLRVSVVASAIRRRRLTHRRRRLLLLLPALAPQHIVEASDEEDAADNAAPIQMR